LNIGSLSASMTETCGDAFVSLIGLVIPRIRKRDYGDDSLEQACLR